jgi:lipid-binding SYLF domain-containing protein
LAASIGLTILSLVASARSFAHSKAELDASAAKTLKHFYALNPKNRKLVDRAVGVLIFSRVTKGGAGVAGESGEGVPQLEGDYYSVGSASIGLTLGIAHHSEIILFMTQEALNRFTASDGWSVGADTAIAVVSEGAGGQYNSAVVGNPILGFIFGDKGLLADVSLEGSKITSLKRQAEHSPAACGLHVILLTRWVTGGPRACCSVWR